MNTFKVWCIALVSFLVLMPNVSSALGIEAALGVWNQSPQGDISSNGPALSLEDDLKLDDTTRIYGRAKIDMPLMIPNVYLMATQSKSDGTGQKAGGFTFNETNFTAGSFTSDLTMNEYDIALYYGLPFIKTASLGKVNVDAGLNLKIADTEVEIVQGTRRETKSYVVPVPMVYVGVQFKPISSLSLEAELRGIALSSDHYYDLIARVKYKVIGPAFIGAGYRYEDLAVDEKQVKTNRRIGGPFFEAGVEF